MKGYQPGARRRNGGPRGALFPALLLCVVASASCGPTTASTGYEPGGLAADAEGAAPPVTREFRGVWVASVSNIDWPSAPGLPVEQQRAELIAILDRAAELHFNAVILQVRPAADALYPSDLEPWSEYLTGESGQPPVPAYDPLELAVTEAHRRGLELHAWFNPYRARHPSAKSPVPVDHIGHTRPDLVWTYGRHLWMDPGEREVQDRTAEVVLDVVRRYDIDGVHLDDYFYPYKERDLQGDIIPFPDSASYARYVAGGGALDRDDWRRQNVDTLIERLYGEIKREKPWVKFGISPFGVWRPGSPRGIGGFDAYTELYADARKWLRNGWVDYFTPQLYWQIARPDVSYPVLLRWWVEQNEADRHVWPGNFTSRWTPEEVIGQILVTRGMPGANGNVHFSMRSLMASPDSLMASSDSLAEKLTATVYGEAALVPASPWLGSTAPGVPSVMIQRAGSGAEIGFEPAAGEGAWLWAIRSRGPDGWTSDIIPGWHSSHPIGADVEAVIVTAIGRTGLESPPVTTAITSGAGATVTDLPISRP